MIKKLELACFSDKGTVRTNNEDNMYASLYDIVNEKSEDYYCAAYEDEYKADFQVFAVFDGMGGTEGGEIASLAAAKQMPFLVERLQETEALSDEKLSSLLFETKKRMEYEISLAMEEDSTEQPGSTCCGIMLHNGMLRPFWIGDSRLYLLRENQLILLTKDHTIAQEKIDYGLITPEEAVTVSSWHYITAYIGDGHNNFTIGEEFAVKPGDKYLLCTDGISDKFSPNLLAEYMTQSSARFIELAAAEVKKNSKDNATALVIALLPEEAKKDFKDIMKEKAKDYFLAVGQKAKENPFAKQQRKV